MKKMMLIAAVLTTIGCGSAVESDPVTTVESVPVTCEEAYIFPDKVPEMDSWSQSIYSNLELCFCSNFLPQIQNLGKDGDIYASLCQSGFISENEIISWSKVSGPGWSSLFESECAGPLKLCEEDQGD